MCDSCSAGFTSPSFCSLPFRCAGVRRELPQSRIFRKRRQLCRGVASRSALQCICRGFCCGWYCCGRYHCGWYAVVWYASFYIGTDLSAVLRTFPSRRYSAYLPRAAEPTVCVLACAEFLLTREKFTRIFYQRTLSPRREGQARKEESKKFKQKTLTIADSAQL